LRRDFLLAGVGAVAALAQEKAEEKPPEIVAGATQDPTPRVGIVLSSFKEGEDHDGTKIAGLQDPQPTNAELSDAQLEAMVRKAIDIGGLRATELYEMIAPDDWVALLAPIRNDARVAGAMLNYLAEHRRGARFTLIDRLGGAQKSWPLEYTRLMAQMAAKFKSAKFELTDLSGAPTIELPADGKPGVSYSIPKLVQECDRIITIAPMATDAKRGVALSMANYAALCAKPTDSDEALLDLFNYKPADFALVCGSKGTEGDGKPVRFNVAVAGMKAVAVDSTAALLMGFKPDDLPYLALGEKRGFGSWDPDEIWTRGNEPEDAKHEFQKPAGWRAPSHG